MIYRNGKGFDYFYHGNRAIQAIYKGTRLVWEGIRSCFGAGYWIPEKPWIETEGWKYYVNRE